MKPEFGCEPRSCGSAQGKCCKRVRDGVGFGVGMYLSDLTICLGSQSHGKEGKSPLLNHLLQHFQSQWGFLEEPGRLRELRHANHTCLGGGGGGGHMP